MFEKEVYIERRKSLKREFNSGLLFFTGNFEVPMNYSANPYHFRQDSTFLYFFGIDKPGFFGLIDLDRDQEYVFGYDFTIDDIIWMGDQPKVVDLAARVGITNWGDLLKLEKMINEAQKKQRVIHYLPQYQSKNILELERLLQISTAEVKRNFSTDLIKAVIKLRSIKSPLEVDEIRKALDISWKMYDTVYKNIKPGMYEYEIWGQLEAVPLSFNTHISFPTIMSVRGETLHNHSHNNQIKEGDLMIIDSGAESMEHYASDITRTFPVGGKFTPIQRDIYQIVLDAQKVSIDMIKPDIRYKEIHLKAAEVIAAGLKDIGLITGDVKDAVINGAHALFFPHGLGHMIGLDVHDMESLGENHVGYNDQVKRNSQFGLGYLRLAKELQTGHVITVEPGIYFIPHLIEKWKSESINRNFINYSKALDFVGFGGIRIEDDVLVTQDGCEVLGSPIPKEVEELEEIIG